MTPELIDRIRVHAAKTATNFSAATRDLIFSGLAARRVPRAETAGELLADILDRLEDRGGDVPFDTETGIWRARCPVEPSHGHPVFVMADIDNTHDLDYRDLDLLCGEHTTEELLVALGLSPHALISAKSPELPTWP